MKFNKLLITLSLILMSICANAQTSPTIAELEQQKEKASAEENYKLAGELKLKIQELKDKEAKDLANAKIIEEQKRKADEEVALKEKQAAELRQKSEEEARQKEKLAEEQRKKAEVEEFKKEIEEATRKKKEEDAALLKEKLAAEQKQKAEEQAALREKQAAEQKQKAEEQAALKEKQAAEQALLREKIAAEQKQKAEEQAILKGKLDAELKIKAEEQLLEKEIALAEVNVKKETDTEVKGIESQIAKAVAAENYLLAEELKGKVIAAKQNGELKLASVATDIKRKKEEKKAQEALEKENAERQRLQLAAEMERKKENEKAIEALEKEKAKAIAETNFKRAEELKIEINNLKGLKLDAPVTTVSKPVVNAKSPTEIEIEKLEKDKAKAVANADFKLAEELKQKIAALKSGKEPGTSNTESKVSGKSATDTELENREKEKAKAVADANYALAGELTKKIKNLKAESEKKDAETKKKAELDAQISELEKQKAKAVTDGDFKLAGDLKIKIQNLKNPVQPKPAVASTTKTTSSPTSRTSSSNLNNSNQSSNSSSAPAIQNASLRVSRSAESESTGIKYRRSSLYTLMVNNTSRERSGVIKDAFVKSPLPANFNDHNLTVATVDVSSNSNATNLVNNLYSYFQTNKIAKDLVAKWFNRNEKGCFNMDLIKERGEYNASNLDLNMAKSSARGLALLGDAGEELIANTYVVINDFRFTNKEEVANKAKVGLGLLSAVSSLAGGPDLSAATTIASAGVTIAGKGYTVRNTSYLFQLVWNPEIAATFYKDYWMDESDYNESKKQAFDDSNLFTLKYVGTESGLADLQSTIFTNKSEDELIYKATTKAVDNGIAKLQRKFEQFRIKTPIYSVDPVTAKIGKKEGLEPGDRFEVLEQVMDENGKLSYKRKGIITVDGRNIWDNTNTIEELTEAGKSTSGNQFTTFKGSGEFFPGMLIRQIN